MPKSVDESAIFEAAATLFVSQGYRGMATKDVAAAAGVNEVTLFRRYGSKAELVRRAIDEQWEKVPLASVATSGDVFDDLVAIVEAYQQTSRSHGAIVVSLLVELTRYPDLEDAFRGGLANIRQLVDLIAGHHRAGHLRAEDPLLTLTTLLGPLMVTEMFRRAGVPHAPDDIDPTAYVRAFMLGRAPAE
jgi:AcrR family transcriptional regulator